MKLVHKTAFFSFLMVSMYSCKQNSEQKSIEIQSVEQSIPENNKINEQSNFSLTLKAFIQKDDDFQLFYIQENSESYSVERMLSKKVVGSNQIQEITFEMPAEYYPFNLRLDFGTNPTQSSIKIEACILNYGSNQYVIKGSEIPNYFTLNDGVERSSDSTTFRLKTFKEGTTDKYDPFLMGNLNLNDVLLKKL